MKIFFSVRGTPWDKKCEKAKIKFKLKHFLSSMMEMFVCFFSKKKGYTLQQTECWYRYKAT